MGLPVQPGRHPWVILVGKTTGWGDHTVEGAWPWVLNCEMRQQPTSGASQFGGLSTHWRSQEEGEGGPPALKDGTDEAAAGVRLSPVLKWARLSSLARLGLGQTGAVLVEGEIGQALPSNVG